MNRYLLIAFLATLQFFIVTNSRATNPPTYGLICDTCYTQLSFENFAANNTPQKSSVAYVANSNTNVIYIISIEWERDGAGSTPSYFITNVSLGNQDLVNGFVAAAKLFGTQHLIVTPPSNNGNSQFGSWASSDQAAVFTRIGGDASVLLADEDAIFWTALSSKFGGYPVITFVYNNGDTAQFQLVTPMEPAACCEYIPGSAKDVHMVILDAPGTNKGGLGVTNGGPPIGNKQNYNYSSPDSGYTCSFYVDGDDNIVEFIGCVQTN